MAFWHGRILSGTLYFQRRGIVVITSENFDGEWIARIIERFGFGTARGSSSRGGLRAMLQLVRDMEKGKPAAFTLDGPRGPARVAQPGAIWLARATGLPIAFSGGIGWGAPPGPTESEVAAQVAADVEPVRVRPLARIAVRRGEHETATLAFRDHVAVDLDITQSDAPRPA